MGDNASRRAPQQVQRVRLAEVAGPVQEFLLARTEPVVLEGACSDWQAIDVCSRLQGDFAEHVTRWRLIPLSSRATVRENECEHVEAPFRDFFAWVEGGCAHERHAFGAGSREEVAAYADYKYMPDLFPDASPIELDWRALGFDYDTVHSTVWVGSRGAHTPLHYDTYGVNLVAQLHGTKTWLLFPPEATPALRPVRVPYEESSVYAEADGRAMRVQAVTSSRGAWDNDISAFIAELSAGDMLWVPRHFWHYVECSSEVTVSANLWIDVPEDVDARVEESLVRFWMGSFVSAVEESGLPCDVAWASSEDEAESLVDHAVNAQLLLNAVRDWTLATHGRVPSASPGDVMRKIANVLLRPEIVALLKRELTETL